MKNDPYLGRYFTVPVSSSCMNRYHKRHQLGTLSLSFFSVFNFYVESSFFLVRKKKNTFLWRTNSQRVNGRGRRLAKVGKWTSLIGQVALVVVGACWGAQEFGADFCEIQSNSTKRVHFER